MNETGLNPRSSKRNTGRVFKVLNIERSSVTSSQSQIPGSPISHLSLATRVFLEANTRSASNRSHHSQPDPHRGLLQPSWADNGCSVIGKPKPRFRAAATESLHDNWDNLNNTLLFQIVRGHVAELQHHSERRRSELSSLTVLIAKGWSCQRVGCTGWCCGTYTTSPEDIDGQTPPSQDQTSVSIGRLKGEDLSHTSGQGGLGQVTVIVVLPHFHTSINVPQFQCDRCGEQQYLQPFHIFCWPATPVAPTVWFSKTLLQEAMHHQLCIAGALQLFCLTKHRLHMDMMAPGTTLPFGTVWRNFGSCWERYRTAMTSLKDPSTYGVRHITEGFCSCPACWRTAVAAIADACLGVPRLQAAGRAQMSRNPLRPEGSSLWVSDSQVKTLILERRGVDISTPCNDFKAAARAIGRRSEIYDELGVASATCRHEFVMLLMNLFTEESLVYYEQMLLVLQKMYLPEDERDLKYFVLDIGCKLRSWWERTRPGEPLPFDLAVGPWHALGHVVPCQKEYGARWKEGMGLTFGDNIEHVWSELRRFGVILKYMSSASRKAFLEDLVRYKANDKLHRFPKTLHRMYEKMMVTRNELMTKGQDLLNRIKVARGTSQLAGAPSGLGQTLLAGGDGNTPGGDVPLTDTFDILETTLSTANSCARVNPNLSLEFELGPEHEYQQDLAEYYALGGTPITTLAKPLKISKMPGRPEQNKDQNPQEWQSSTRRRLKKPRSQGPNSPGLHTMQETGVSGSDQTV